MEVEDRVVVLRVVGLCPHLTHRPEPERLHTVLYDDRHLAHVPSLHPRWQKLNGACHSCHSWQALRWRRRSEEPTSELQSLMRITNAVFCLKKTSTNQQPPSNSTNTQRPTEE